MKRPDDTHGDPAANHPPSSPAAGRPEDDQKRAAAEMSAQEHARATARQAQREVQKGVTQAQETARNNSRLTHRKSSADRKPSLRTATHGADRRKT